MKQLADNFAKVIKGVFPDETGYCAVRTGSIFKDILQLCSENIFQIFGVDEMAGSEEILIDRTK